MSLAFSALLPRVAQIRPGARAGRADGVDVQTSAPGEARADLQFLHAAVTMDVGVYLFHAGFVEALVFPVGDQVAQQTVMQDARTDVGDAQRGPVGLAASSARNTSP